MNERHLVTAGRHVFGLDVCRLSWIICSLITCIIKSRVIITDVTAVKEWQIYEVSAHFDDFVMEPFVVWKFLDKRILVEQVFKYIRTVTVCPVESAVSTNRTVKVWSLSSALNTTVTTCRLFSHCNRNVKLVSIITQGTHLRSYALSMSSGLFVNRELTVD